MFQRPSCPPLAPYMPRNAVALNAMTLTNCRLCNRLAIMGICTGILCALLMWLLKDQIINLLLDSTSTVTRGALDDVWLLLSLMQITNSVVFTYDGLLAAASQFAFVRNVIVFGVTFIFAPAVGVGYSSGILLGLWLAKAMLNSWRCATSVIRVNGCLFRQWQSTAAAEAPAGPGAGQRRLEKECTDAE